jgi:hypothetical protein
VPAASSSDTPAGPEFPFVTTDLILSLCNFAFSIAMSFSPYPVQAQIPSGDDRNAACKGDPHVFQQAERSPSTLACESAFSLTSVTGLATLAQAASLGTTAKIWNFFAEGSG